MVNEVKSIDLDKLLAHPGNANVMSNATFRKLVRNIERTGLYEPLVVRRHRQRRGHYEIINGHHRCKALRRLDRDRADCVVWDVDDEQTEVLLATLNRLSGRDRPTAKIALLEGLSRRMGTSELGKLLPMSKTQIERLCRLKEQALNISSRAKPMASAMVFFVKAGQKKIIERALDLATKGVEKGTPTQKRTAALTAIAGRYVKTADSVQRIGISCNNPKQ